MKVYVVIAVSEDEIEVEKVFLNTVSVWEWFKSRPDFDGLSFFTDGAQLPGVDEEGFGEWISIFHLFGAPSFHTGTHPAGKRVEIYDHGDGLQALPCLIFQEIETS